MNKYLSDCKIYYVYNFQFNYKLIVVIINIIEEAQLKYICPYNEKSINVSKKLEEILMNYEF